MNTLAKSYISSASLSQGSAAEMAAVRKTLKYSTLPESIIFQPLAFETLGPMNQSGVDFFSELGCRLEQVSGDARERCFIFQRLSITVQRFNSVAFRGSFFNQPDLRRHSLIQLLLLILVFSPRESRYRGQKNFKNQKKK